MAQKTNVNLGFAEVELPPGTHICQIYNDDDERNDALLHFLLSGLKLKEKNACFSEKLDQKELEGFLSENGLDFADSRARGALITAGTSEVYFQDGKFDPDHMLTMLKNFHCAAHKQGYSAARVIGEMTPQIHKVPGGSRLFEYEARVNDLLKEHPVTAFCQYDAHAFDGATLMDVMKVHPMMLVRGNVIHNPFYIPAENI